MRTNHKHEWIFSTIQGDTVIKCKHCPETMRDDEVLRRLNSVERDLVLKEYGLWVNSER